MRTPVKPSTGASNHGFEPGAICQNAHPQEAKSGKCKYLLKLKTPRSSVAWEFFTGDYVAKRGY
jgi:hypothetical protein